MNSNTDYAKPRTFSLFFEFAVLASLLALAAVASLY